MGEKQVMFILKGFKHLRRLFLETLVRIMKMMQVTGKKEYFLVFFKTKRCKKWSLKYVTLSDWIYPLFMFSYLVCVHYQ